MDPTHVFVATWHLQPTPAEAPGHRSPAAPWPPQQIQRGPPPAAASWGPVASPPPPRASPAAPRPGESTAKQAVGCDREGMSSSICLSRLEKLKIFPVVIDSL